MCDDAECSNVTRTECVVVRKSIENEITVFPVNLRFPATFPNVPVERKIIVSNSKEAPEDVVVSLKGDPEFGVSERRLRVMEGETVSVVVRFCPRSVNVFSGTLLVSGSEVVRVRMTGSCVASPLEIPAVSSDAWVFPRRKVEKVFRLSNKSLYMPLRVVMATNCSAFSVRPQEVDIAPASWAEVRCSFSPKTQVVEEPQLVIQCAESGDNVTVPLRIETVKPVVVVDFGTTSVNSKVVETLSLETEQTVGDVPWPFSVEKADGVSSIEFGFCSHKVDTYECKVELEDLFVKLIGRSVEPPYRVFFPPNFPHAPLTVSNITRGPLNLVFSVRPASFVLSKSEVELKPNQTIALQVSGGTRDMSEFVLVVEWDTDLLDHVIDYHRLDDDHDASRMTEIEPSDIGLEMSSESIKSPNKRSFGAKNQRFSYSVSGIRPEISASTSLLAFPNVSSSRGTSVTLTVSCDQEFDVDVPEWIEIDDIRQSNIPIQLSVRSLQAPVVCGEVIVRTETSELAIPAIAYRGCSRIIVDSSVELRSRSRSQGVATIDVQNTGGRAGFVLFTVPDEFHVNITPKAVVVPPNSISSVKIVVPNVGDVRIPVVAYTGDEILRQILARVSPTDFFASSFEHLEIQEEVAVIAPLFDSLKLRDINSLFKKNLRTTHISVRPPEKASAFKQVTVSPTQVELIGKEPASVSLLNLSSKPLEFVASSRSSHVRITPTKGTAPPYGEAIITVEMSKPEIACVELKCAGECFTIPVSPIAPTKVKLETSYYEDHSLSLLSGSHSSISTRQPQPKYTDRGGFSVSKCRINFATCEVGQSLTKSVTISNDEPAPMRLTIKSTNDAAFSCKKTVTVPASGNLVLDIEFHPDTLGPILASLLLENEDNQLTLDLVGEGVDGSAISLSGLSHSEFHFPPCLPGTLRRAQLRINNKKSDPAFITAWCTPPFTCSHTSFDIQPFGSLICPIHFTPMAPGTYEGTLTLKSSAGNTTTVRLVGTCLS